MCFELFRRTLLMLVCAWIVIGMGTFSAAEAPTAGKLVRITQPDGPTCDFDVTLPGDQSPAFRLLAPEHLTGQGITARRLLHTISGRWTVSPQRLDGAFNAGPDVRMAVRMEPRASEARVTVTVTNTGQQEFRNVCVNVCANLNRLPSEHPWSNRNFIPAKVPPQRDAQGRYWYDQIAPRNLLAWSPQQGWMAMLIPPALPEKTKTGPYDTKVSLTGNSYLCAVPSLDGKRLFFMAWDAKHCRHQSPFPGNACMHLLPQIAEQIKPGESATVHGVVGVFTGSREELVKKVVAFRKEAPAR